MRLSGSSHSIIRHGKILAFVVVVSVSFFGFSQTAHAAVNWPDGTGFFSHAPSAGWCGPNACTQPPDWNDVIPENPNCSDPSQQYEGYNEAVCPSSVDDFIGQMRADSNALSNGNTANNRRRNSGAAMVFWTILGHDGYYADAHGGRTVSNFSIPGVAGTGWDAMSNLLKAEEADGQITIHWNDWVGAPNEFYEQVGTGDKGDITIDSGSSSQAQPAIEIVDNANGNVIYKLFRFCANPGGTIQGLPLLKGWTLTGVSDVAPKVAQRGQAVVFTHTIHNQGPSTADFSRRIQDSFPNNGPFNNKTALKADSLGSGNDRVVTDNYTIPMNANNGDVYCERIFFTNATGSGTPADTSKAICVAVSVPPTCGNVSTQPGLVQPGDTFTTTVTIGLPGGPPTYTALHVSIPGISPADNNALPLSLTPAGNPNKLSYTFPLLTAPAAGVYTVNWQLFNGAAGVGPPCSGSIIVTDLPYFKVYGADISAGGDFSTCPIAGCTSTSGTISSWYNSAAAAKAGASTLFAAIALGKITGFASGQETTGGAPAPGGSENVLTLANPPIVGVSPSEVFGGQFGGAHPFFTPAAPAGSPVNDVPAVATVGNGILTTGAHGRIGNLTLNGVPIPVTAPGTIGNNVAVYVQGDVYISSNITYGGGAWTINANGTSNIPSFVIVATGNIYIAPGVTELDGIYVAEKGAVHGGTIYTCGQASFTPVTAVNLFGCNNQLTVYGSFIADQVDLMRTFGTLKNAQATEDPVTGANRACANGVVARVCGAEVFNFSPEMYLSQPEITQPSNGGVTYDSITGLPPVL